jgi:hypothetical protein
MGLDEDIERLGKEAEGVIQLAIQERDRNPDMTDEIFETAISRIKNEIFGSGALGPATGAADPDPYIEQLGQAFDRFDERVLEKGLSLETVIEVAHRAAKDLNIKKYSIGKVADTPAGSKFVDIKVRMEPSKAMVVLGTEGLTMDNLNHLDIEEQYFDIFRCRVYFDGKTKQLVVRGRKDFVDEVMEGL